MKLSPSQIRRDGVNRIVFHNGARVYALASRNEITLHTEAALRSLLRAASNLTELRDGAAYHGVKVYRNRSAILA